MHIEDGVFGNLYRKLGFSLTYSTMPNYFYFKKNSIVLLNRLLFQKHKLIKILENYDEKLSEY